MPAKHPKRPRDPNQLGKLIALGHCGRGSDDRGVGGAAEVGLWRRWR